MKKPKDAVKIDYLHTRLNYNAESGVFMWKPLHQSLDKRGWNARHANKVAGHVKKLGYVIITILPYKLLAHRVAWAMSYGYWPDHLLDHRDGDPSNNSIQNLRPCSYAQNMANRKTYARKYDLPRGVSYCGKRYRASITVAGQIRWSGMFDCPMEAHQAYNEQVETQFGEFSYTARLKGMSR